MVTKRKPRRQEITDDAHHVGKKSGATSCRNEGGGQAAEGRRSSAIGEGESG